MANYTLNYSGEKVDELLNKIDTAFGETTVTKDAITWDGNTEGLDSVMGMLYRVSGATPTLEDMQNGGTIKTFTPDGEMSVEFTGEQAMDGETAGMGTNLIVLNGGAIPILIATQDGATIIDSETTISIEKAGIYLPSGDGAYISYFAINNYQFEDVEITPIDPKYLPNKTMTINISNYSVSDKMYTIEDMGYTIFLNHFLSGGNIEFVVGAGGEFSKMRAMSCACAKTSGNMVCEFGVIEPIFTNVYKIRFTTP